MQPIRFLLALLVSCTTAATLGQRRSSSLALLFFPLLIEVSASYFEDVDFDFDSFGNEGEDLNEDFAAALDTDTIDISVSNILENYNKVDSKMAHERVLSKLSLAYVTPWNNRGYDIAKIFRGKFTHISPVWYQVKPDRSASTPGTYILTGDHDVDAGWMKEVTTPVTRQDGSILQPKMVPRFMVSDLVREDLDGLVKQSSHYKSVADVIIKECKKRKHDGFVLEFLYAAYTPQLIEYLSVKARKAKLQFFLVIAPQHGDSILFDKPQFDLYKKLVDGFSLMTYDYSNPQNPGPNAPFAWVKENILRLCPEPNESDRAKLLVGINLYGNDYSGVGHDSVLGDKYIKLLKEHDTGSIAWNSHLKEAVFRYLDEGNVAHEVWYPTLESIETRLEMFEALGTGVSMWEIGQGLESFYALF